MKAPRLVALMIAGSAALCATAPAQNKPAREFLIVGYLPDYRLDTFNPRQAALVTDIIYLAAEPRDSGELNLQRIRPRHLETLKRARQDHGVRLHLALGGWERGDGFAPVAADPAKRKKLTQAAREFCREHEFAGIDLDWEFPKGADEEQNFTRLLADLHAGLAEDQRLLSIAIAPWQKLPMEAWASVDRVHAMSYDSAGRHSTLEQAGKDIERLLAQGMPREKLLLGLPCYGRHVKDREKSLAWLEIVARHDPPTTADEIDGYYFNGPSTIGRKTKLAQAERLAGVFFWELGQDTDGARSLVKAAKATAAGSR